MFSFRAPLCFVACLVCSRPAIGSSQLPCLQQQDQCEEEPSVMLLQSALKLSGDLLAGSAGSSNATEGAEEVANSSDEGAADATKSVVESAKKTVEAKLQSGGQAEAQQRRQKKQVANMMQQAYDAAHAHVKKQGDATPKGVPK
eukprot:TRINITY_DN38703_c0_g1_i1.p1 TRINITY_DN38703_c0_g1~~TRINITY_DN38703_c0_g1_i1.p1  ORF type:complete len:144 (+),score=38.77 TRINITY_DN38703_c0_g1_i1:197-628(+)